MSWLLLILLLSRYNNGCGCSNGCGCNCERGVLGNIPVPAAFTSGGNCCGQETGCPCSGDNVGYNSFTENIVQNRQMSMPASWQRYDMNDNSDCGCNK